MATAETSEQMTDEGRALLTDREREILSGDADVTDNYRYKVQSTVRNRVRNRFDADVDLLESAFPEVHEMLVDEVCEMDVDRDTREARQRVEALKDERAEFQEQLADAHERIDDLEERLRQQRVDADRIAEDLEAALEAGDERRVEAALERLRELANGGGE